MAMSVESCNNSFSKASLDNWKSTLSDDDVHIYLSDFPCDSKRVKSGNQQNSELQTSKIEEAIRDQFRVITLQAERKDNGFSLIVNIVACDKIGKPSVSREKRNSITGFQWTIPHVICKPRRDICSKNSRNLIGTAPIFQTLQNGSDSGIWVYDVIVNPVCIAISKENANLLNNLVQTVTIGIEEKFHIILNQPMTKVICYDHYFGNLKNSRFETESGTDSCQDETNLYKCTNNQDNNLKSNDGNDSDVSVNEDLNNLDQPVLSNLDPLDSSKIVLLEAANGNKNIPEYKLKYVNYSSLEDYQYSALSKDTLNCRPDSLALEIKLPNISKVSDIDAKVVGKEFILRTSKNYHYCLSTSLPYEVEENPSKAQFDLSTRLLTLEFAVKRIGSMLIPNVKSPDLFPDSGIECEGYRTNSECDNSSIGSQEEYDNISSLLSAESVTKDKLINLDKLLLSPLTLSQNVNFLYITLSCTNIITNSLNITAINSHCLTIKYMIAKTGYDNICYGVLVCVQPFFIKTESLDWSTKDDNLTVKVEKSNPSIWKEVHIGLNENELTASSVNVINEKEVPLNGSSCTGITNYSEENAPKNVCEENVAKETEAEFAGLLQNTSHSIKISRSRCTSDCFVTGSWPKGILKGRSRSLSDSHYDSSWVFGSFTELEDEVLEEDDDETYTQSESESQSAKKSVRFNDFIAKQVFRADASILGQRAKNQKKAQQKKRSRERKLSEGNSSSQNQSEQSDTAATTTEDESNTEGEATDAPKKYSKTGKNNSKTKSSKGKKKSKKVPYLSNDLIFQLDDS